MFLWCPISMVMHIKMLTFSQEHSLYVENECRCPRTVKISNINFIEKNVYLHNCIHIYVCMYVGIDGYCRLCGVIRAVIIGLGKGCCQTPPSDYLN